MDTKIILELCIRAWSCLEITQFNFYTILLIIFLYTSPALFTTFLDVIIIIITYIFSVYHSSYHISIIILLFSSYIGSWFVNEVLLLFQRMFPAVTICYGSPEVNNS